LVEIDLDTVAFNPLDQLLTNEKEDYMLTFLIKNVDHILAIPCHHEITQVLSIIPAIK